LRLGVDDRVGKALQNQGRPPLEYFKCPVVLKPQEIARRRLEFLQYGGFLQDGRTSLRDALNHHMREFKYEIEIIDHVSGRSIRIPVPGEYRG
jgi:hypothetical protein